VRKSERKRLPGKPRRRGKDHIKIDFKEQCMTGLLGRIYLAKNRGSSRVLVKRY
jgi:hypothetical protein